MRLASHVKLVRGGQRPYPDVTVVVDKQSVLAVVVSDAQVQAVHRTVVA